MSDQGIKTILGMICVCVVLLMGIVTPLAIAEFDLLPPPKPSEPRKQQPSISHVYIKGYLP